MERADSTNPGRGTPGPAADRPARQAFGAPMPDFTLPRVGPDHAGGEPVTLSACLEGRLGGVVLFWSGTCSHCTRYDDYLNRFEERHPRLALVAVASRQDEDLAKLEGFVRRRGLRFVLVHDADRAVAHRWLVRQTPRAFLLDAERRLVYRGAVDNYTYPRDPEHEAYLEDEIAALSAGEPGPHRETAGYGCPIESVYYELPKPMAGSDG